MSTIMWYPNPTDYCGWYYVCNHFCFVSCNGGNIFTLNANGYTTIGVLPETVTPVLESSFECRQLGSTTKIYGIINKSREIKIYNTGAATYSWLFSVSFPV